jgi:CDP-2,3-bis-(O-geranylgeranyl)-sn-glycerol synthase
MNFLWELLFAFWFFAPAGVANILAFFSGKITFLKPFDLPVDGGLKFRKKRILGSHKTVRGFICGIIGAIIIVYIQILLYNFLPFIHVFTMLDYSQINPWLLGFLAGFGALAGDSVKSFFKRQMNIAPGKSWFPFDQIDYILGGIIFTALYIKLGFWQYLFIAGLWFLIHPFTTLMGWLIKLKEEPL